nr:hypothetical protein BCU07_09640 [Vibrio sp. 10N.261.54.E10]
MLEQSYDQIFSFSIILLCLYIAVPSQDLILNPGSDTPLETPNNDNDTKQAQTDAEVTNAQ